MVQRLRGSALAFVACLPCVLLIQQAPAIASELNRDEDIRHGAVLCIWSIYRAVSEFGEQCVADKDNALQDALKASIQKMDVFIMANSPLNAERLEDFKRSRTYMPPPNQVCAQDLRSLYELMKKGGRDAIDRQTSSMLAVARKPSMDPCL